MVDDIEALRAEIDELKAWRIRLEKKLEKFAKSVNDGFDLQANVINENNAVFFSIVRMLARHVELTDAEQKDLANALVGKLASPDNADEVIRQIHEAEIARRDPNEGGYAG